MCWCKVDIVRVGYAAHPDNDIDLTVEYNASSSVVATASAIACAASGGTSLPLRSRQSAPVRPSSSSRYSGSLRLWSRCK